MVYINPTCGAQAKLLGCQNAPEDSILPARTGDIRKQHWPTACSNFCTEDKVPFLSFFLDLKGSRAGEQVVSPTAALNINPGGSTRRKFQMDTGEECIPEET